MMPQNTTFFLTNTEPRPSSTSGPSNGSSAPNSLDQPSSKLSAMKVDMSKSWSAMGGSGSALSSIDMSDIESFGPGSPGRPISNWSPASFISVDEQLSADSHSCSSLNVSMHASPNLTGLDSTMGLNQNTCPDNTGAATGGGTTDNKTPQFVMPKVPMPSRKPFTDNGLRLGKLKILVAGDTGIGKSQLIKALTQTHADFVHVDEWERLSGYNHGLQEATASTKPRPLFWLVDNNVSETNHPAGFSSSCSSSLFSTSAFSSSIASNSSSGTMRRQSIVQSSSSSQDSILDRNICFVDSTGYGQGSTSDDCMDTVIQYLEDKFHETANLINIANAQALNLLASSSSLADSPHVDVCFYLILNRLKQVDLEYMERISEYAPVIPLIAKSDLLPEKETISLKLQILREMRTAKIDPFLFDTPIDEAIRCAEEKLEMFSNYSMLAAAPNGDKDIKVSSDNSSAATPENRNDNTSEGSTRSTELPSLDPLLFPTAICSLHHIDEEMLASILMSADYTPALVQSELQDLCSYVFSEQGSAWLRYNAAKRFINWCVSTELASSLRVGLFLPLKSASSTSELSTPQQSLVHVEKPKFWVSPSFNLEPTRTTVSRGPDCAQKQTARWAMQLEHASRTENALQLRSRGAAISRRNRFRKYRNSSGQSDKENAKLKTQMSKSIVNLDPLGIRNVPKKIFNFAFKAVTVLISLRVVSILMSKVLNHRIIAHTESNTGKSSSERFLSTALSSLGGGWSILA